MDKSEAEKIIDDVIRTLEEGGVDHYTKTLTEERRGGQKYIELRVSIKIK